MSTFKINLHETIFFLSDALNLVAGNQIDHGKRVAFMVAECALALKWDRKRIDDLFLAAILHDCGVSKTAVYERLVNFEGKNAGNHCSRGEKLLKASPPLAYLSDCILHHHVDWVDLKGIDLPDKVKMGANCIYLLDRVDLLALDYLRIDSNILASKEHIRKKIFEKRDTWFHPQLVDTFLEISKPEAFWLALEKGHNSGYARSWIEHDLMSEIDFIDLKSIVMIYSRIVDEKSYFTKQHSEGVGCLSRYLGELMGLSEHICDKLEIAGLLHDLGKLRVPDHILDKPDRLTESELLVMQRHSYDTYDIIKDIKGFEEISVWASQHHERNDGSGYPYRCSKEDLSLEARIIALADVFQSLAQNRPHREKLKPEEILSMLKKQGNKGKLDKDVILMVEKNLAGCWQAAKPVGC
ncbi:MAG: HD domain-containing protein [Methylococcaceae bacterium]|nr:HD domain-containing protein [Methylococcaceae bacterium]